MRKLVGALLVIVVMMVTGLFPARAQAIHFETIKGTVYHSAEYKAARRLLSFKTEIPIDCNESFFFRLRYQLAYKKNNVIKFTNLLIWTYQYRF